MNERNKRLHVLLGSTDKLLKPKEIDNHKYCFHLAHVLQATVKVQGKLKEAALAARDLLKEKTATPS